MSKFLCTYILGYSIAVSCLIPTSSKAVESNTQSQLSQFQCTETEMNKYIQQLKNGESAAFNRLVECNSKAVPALTKALENEDENLRIALITALGEIGGNAKDAVSKIAELLLNKNESLDIRYVASKALENIGSMQAISILRKNRSMIPHIRSLRPRGTPARVRSITLRRATSTYINRKPPLICNIPQIKNLLLWKCP